MHNLKKNKEKNKKQNNIYNYNCIKLKIKEI